MKYCINCERMVEPKKDFSLGIFIVLLILGLIPGIIYVLYFLIKQGSCPMCNSKHWGIPPKKKHKS